MTRRRVTWIFLGILGLGAIGLTVLFRLSQDGSLGVAVSPEKIDDRIKIFADMKVRLSERLFNLAFATLAGLVGLHVKAGDSAGRRSDGWLPVSAAALLSLSLYAAFLFQTGIGMALGPGPLTLIYGPLLDLPLTAQFWLFVAGIILLLFWVLPPAAQRLFLVALLCAAPIRPTFAADSFTACVGPWQTSRGVTLSAAAETHAATVVARVAQRAAVDIPVESRCDYAASLLDEYRRVALKDALSDADALSKLEQRLATTFKATESANFAPGEFLNKLLALSQIWRVPSGLLTVDSKQDTVYIIVTRKQSSSHWEAYSNWVIRLPTAHYRVRVYKDDQQVRAYDDVVIEDGKRWAIVIP